VSFPQAIALPKEAVSLDEVIANIAPDLRQSDLADFDDCALSSWFGMRYDNGWTSHPQAGGIIFHRFAFECLRAMQANDSEEIAVSDALAILEEVLEQRGIPASERVRVPMRDIPTLRWTAAKFARDNAFSIRQLVDVESRLAAELEYRDDEGQVRKRMITGQPDVLVADPNHEKGAIIVDYKYTWGLPGGQDSPDWPEKAGANSLSYHGFFQLRLYGWLVMRKFTQVDRVTLREFYPRRTKAREASVHRGQMDRIEEMLRLVVLDFDRALASGPPESLKTPEDAAPWTPSPGQHCYWCVAKRLCPIPPEARKQIAVSSPEEAAQRVAELQVAEAIREGHRETLRPWVEANGPIRRGGPRAAGSSALRTRRPASPSSSSSPRRAGTAASPASRRTRALRTR
jgi:hypothetical protein